MRALNPWAAAGDAPLPMPMGGIEKKDLNIAFLPMPCALPITMSDLTYLWRRFASWISTQPVRWRYLPADEADYDAIGEQIFLTNLARELAEELGADAPKELTRVENLKFADFDPGRPDAYLKQQLDKYGV